MFKKEALSQWVKTERNCIESSIENRWCTQLWIIIIIALASQSTRKSPRHNIDPKTLALVVSRLFFCSNQSIKPAATIKPPPSFCSDSKQKKHCLQIGRDNAWKYQIIRDGYWFNQWHWLGLTHRTDKQMAERRKSNSANHCSILKVCN